MSIEVKVPVLPESVTDATIATWHKTAGDTIKRDENIVDLETDKVVLEVPAPVDGVLKSIEKQTGDVVSNDEILAYIEAGEVKNEPKQETSSSVQPEKQVIETNNNNQTNLTELSPAVRRIVEENNIDPTQITGTGRSGRIIKEDVLNYLEQQSTSQPELASDNNENTVTQSFGAREEKRIPMTRLRARIAERMIESQQNAALLTSFNEVNLHQVMNIRKQYKEIFEKQHDVRLGLMSFFVKAACYALQQHPIVNASVENNDVVYHQYMDIGIAVSTDKGLVVPVLRNAENMSFAEVELAINNYAKKARDGNIAIEDLQGGTFTITNGGVFGSLISTPIVNPPQSAILGMHTIKERPIAENGEVVIRPMMYIALTYDHRIIDGKDAVQFLVAIKNSLEDPHRLLLAL